MASTAAPSASTQPLVRLKARMANGTHVSIWRGWTSTWAAIEYATDILGAQYASARVVQPAKAAA